MKQELPITFDTKIVIRDAKTKEVLREGKNAIHPQNMSRVIARALANEPNALIHRIAFGNGGTYTDAAGNVVFNPPNDGNSGGWEARLYNETYSEIVDELHPDFKNDPGSADVNNVRMAGGASPSDDPEGGGVTSVEVGRKSNIVVTMVINENEPNGQLLDQNVGPMVEADETYFMFDEIGLYAPGRPAKSTSGYSTVNVGTAKTSTDTTNLTPNTDYTLALTVNEVSLVAVLHTPTSGTSAGGSFTYGDICEGINTGAWLTSGDSVDDYVTVYITDRSGGAYPSILGMQSYGFLAFESKLTGAASNVELTCNSNASNFFNVITNGVCGNVNVNSIPGVTAGVANDPVNSDNERERLLTHFIFDPILKSRDRAIEIEYTLTVSVGRTADSQVIQVTGTPLPVVPSPTPSPAPSPTPTPTIPTPEGVTLVAYLYDGRPAAESGEESALNMLASSGTVTEMLTYIHIHGLPENATPDNYHLIVDSWTQNNGAVAMGASDYFSASGDFAGDYGSSVGGDDPFVGPEWDTDKGNGVRLNGLTRLAGYITNAQSGISGEGHGTAMIRLMEKVYNPTTENYDDVEVANLEITWSYMSMWS